jgi:hypothetical protein
MSPRVSARGVFERSAGNRGKQIPIILIMYAPWKLTGCGATGIEPDFALMKFKDRAFFAFPVPSEHLRRANEIASRQSYP